MESNYPGAGGRHDPSQQQQQQYDISVMGHVSASCASWFILLFVWTFFRFQERAWLTARLLWKQYGASAALVANSSVPQSDIYSGAFANVGSSEHSSKHPNCSV
jgi:hypothetical protein